ncbi:MAG: HAMP domain-containing protein [Gammaproteobacteria bacterium]|nr:HAMP domain-containing protein [Gammaproteobacteria bacterium]
MKIFNNLTIKLRLVFLVVFSSALMIIIGILGLNGMNTQGDAMTEMYEKRLVASGELGEIIGLMRDNRTQLLLALQHDPTSPYAKMHNHETKQHTDRVAANIKQITKIWSGYMARGLDEEEKVLADAFAKTRKMFVDDGLQPTREGMIAGEFAKANKTYLEKVNPLFKAADADVEKLLQLKLKLAKKLEVQAEEAHGFMVTVFLALMICGIGLSALLAFFTIRGISSAVNDLQQTANRISKGDLTARTSYNGGDELGRVATDFNNVSETFHGVISELADATGQMASAAEQTASITEQTSSGLQRQKEETEQVATAMNEMNATAQEVARNAQHAAQATHDADEASLQGRQVVEKAISVINDVATDVESAAGVIQNLEAESLEIGKVLDVIRGIAEQTNLLALNAAIEAARAGEQGRGFAVVADEVRTLASRTQESTQEIDEMITRLQGGANDAVKAMQKGTKQAESGVEQAAEAGNSLVAITQAVAQISNMNIQIASAAEEQTAVAEEINRNIMNISDVANSTAEGAEQTAQASGQVATLSEGLLGLVAKFKI